MLHYIFFLPPVGKSLPFSCYKIATFEIYLPTWQLCVPPSGIRCHSTFISATSWQFPATIVAFNAKKVAYQCYTTFFFATTWQILATNATYQCHITLIFATSWQFRATFVAYQCHSTSAPF
jgi:hypothetical protein